MRVNFICNGNAYRSRMAESYLLSRGTDIEVISSGVRADKNRDKNVPVVTDFTNDFLQRHVLPVIAHEPRQLTQAMLNNGDILVAINPVVVENMRAGFDVPDGLIVWDIADFDEQTERDIEAHSEFILNKIRGYVDELVAGLL